MSALGELSAALFTVGELKLIKLLVDEGWSRDSALQLCLEVEWNRARVLRLLAAADEGARGAHGAPEARAATVYPAPAAAGPTVAAPRGLLRTRDGAGAADSRSGEECSTEGPR